MDNKKASLMDWVEFLCGSDGNAVGAATANQPVSLEGNSLHRDTGHAFCGHPLPYFSFFCCFGPLGPGRMIDAGTLDPVRPASRINFAPELGVSCDPTLTAGEDSFRVFRLPADVLDVINQARSWKSFSSASGYMVG